MKMKLWKGYWVMATAIIHTIFGLIVFRDNWLIIFQNGFVNSINSTSTAIAFWFFIVGQVLFMLGSCILQIEQQGKACSKVISYNLGAMALIGAFVMPVSGIWLLFPPTIGLILDSNKSSSSAVLEMSETQ